MLLRARVPDPPFQAVLASFPHTVHRWSSHVACTESTWRVKALFVLHGQGTVVQRNRLVGNSGATGLRVVESNDVLAIRNRFAGLAEGIVFEGASNGAYRGNLTSGVAVPYSGGTDAGGNE